MMHPWPDRLTYNINSFRLLDPPTRQNVGLNRCEGEAMGGCEMANFIFYGRHGGSEVLLRLPTPTRNPTPLWRPTSHSITIPPAPLNALATVPIPRPPRLLRYAG